MAIVQTFEACLESPYLSRDDSAADRVGPLLAQAGDRLGLASDLAENPKADPADRCFFCYEAMFCCLRALVYRKGYREAGLRCLVLACEALYVRTGLLDPSHLIQFDRAQRLVLSPAEALDAASAFHRRTLDLLEHEEKAGPASPSVRP